MFDQLLGSLLFLLGLSGSVKGESTQSATASQSAVTKLTTALTNVLSPATKSGTVTLKDMKAYTTLFAEKSPTWQAHWEKNMGTFQEQLTAQVTDETKKTHVLSIQNQLYDIKTSRMHVMRQELTALEQTIEGMKEQSGTISGVLTKTRIPEAETSLSQAASALYMFAEKQYIITLTHNGKNLKEDVTKVRKQLETDVKTVETAVIAARKKVKAAYDDYKKQTKKTITVSVSTDILNAQTETAGKTKN